LLFTTAYNRGLTTDEAVQLSEQTSGWAIALQLLGQSAQQGHGDETVAHSVRSTALHDLPADSREVLFAYLAQEVLAKQPDDVRDFLLRSAILVDLRPEVLNAILGRTDSAAMLRSLDRRGLFVTTPDAQVYHYHPLFHEFLQTEAKATLADWAGLHRRAVQYYRTADVGEQVLYHLLVLDDIPTLAAELERLAQLWVDDGQLVTLLAWLDHLPDAVVTAHPLLLLARGDAARLLSRFDIALAAYTAAQKHAAGHDPVAEARALIGQAQIYLDTVQPALAEPLLHQAYQLLTPEQQRERRALWILFAENRLNAGRPMQAARLYRCLERGASKVDVNPVLLPPRCLLRLGRLAEARGQLERELRASRVDLQQRRIAAHREATLLLSLIAVLDGDVEMAVRLGQQQVNVEGTLGATLFTAVAHMRLGHALQLGPSSNLLAANQHYIHALTLADSFGVPRLKAEAYLGLALLHGFGGDFAAAQAAALEGIAVVKPSGDAWMTALLWTALGAIGVTHRVAEATTWLDQADHLYRKARDTYGQAVVQLWLALWYQSRKQLDEAARYVRAVLSLTQEQDYLGLLTRPTLLGPRDAMQLVPLLLLCRADGPSDYAQVLLSQGFPAIANDSATEIYHPGTTLRIYTLGSLRVVRGTQEILPREWQRKKAQQLLALLVTNRHRWLLREQICDLLWPDDDVAEAEKQFKVTLNALNGALEPTRPPRTPPFYIRRQGGAYRFAPPAGVWLDVDEFEAQIVVARQLASEPENVHVALMQAVNLYSGDYLSDFLYEEWTHTERERLAARYLQAATQLAEFFVQQRQLSEALQLCEVMITRDPAWEPAYALLIRIYTLQGNRRQALLAYEQCARNLRLQLGVEPLPATTQLAEAAKRTVE